MPPVLHGIRVNKIVLLEKIQQITLHTCAMLKLGLAMHQLFPSIPAANCFHIAIVVNDHSSVYKSNGSTPLW